MSKLRELKLKDVEALSSIQLMSASGSASESEASGPCSNECSSEEDCANKLGL